jgi:hypothetical protein
VKILNKERKKTGGLAPALQVQNPEFKPQSHKKENKRKKSYKLREDFCKIYV